MLNTIITIFKKMNQTGIYIPVLRDPVSQLPSVSLTLVFLSFNCVLIGLSGKAAGFFGGVDLNQAIMLYTISTGLYFSRRIGKDGSKVELTKEDKND